MKLNAEMIRVLMIKDWQLNQKPIAAYVLGAIIGLGIMSIPHLWGFYMGAVTLLTIMIASGFHIINATIIQEKKEQTLPFIMSLPVRPIEFALAKIFANATIFIFAWLVVVLGFTFLIFTGPIPDGILIFFFLISIHVIANYFIVLSVAINTESEGWSIFTMVFLNLFLNPVIMLLVRSPKIHSTFENDIIAWSDLATYVVFAEIITIIIAVLVIVFRQSRRKTFI